MKDDIILQLLEATCKGLEGVFFPVTMPHLMPSYRALVIAAAANHPENLFLRTLIEIAETGANDDGKQKTGFAYGYETGGKAENGGNETRFHFTQKGNRRESGPEEMRILFTQLRIVLESLQPVQEPPRY